jgi:hypothetical protein
MEKEQIVETELKDIFLKITGKCMLPKKLLKNYTYTIQTDIVIQGENEKVNKSDPGSHNLYFTGEMNNVAEIINNKGFKIKTKMVGSQSQKLRFTLYNFNETNMENNEFYESIMSVLIDNPAEVVRLANELKGRK